MSIMSLKAKPRNLDGQKERWTATAYTILKIQNIISKYEQIFHVINSSNTLLVLDLILDMSSLYCEA